MQAHLRQPVHELPCPDSVKKSHFLQNDVGEEIVAQPPHHLLRTCIEQPAQYAARQVEHQVVLVAHSAQLATFVPMTYDG